MTIKELFELAIEYEQTDLQALIMFLVFEKQVHTMDEDKSALDLYFLDKHHDRMTHELTEYKKKMNITYPPDVYEVETTTDTLYILANHMQQARAFSIYSGFNPIDVRAALKSDEFYINNVRATLKELTQNKKTPSIIGKEVNLNGFY